MKGRLFGMNLQSILLRGATPEAVERFVDRSKVQAIGHDLVVYPEIELSLEHLYHQEERFAALTAELSQQLNCLALGVVNLEDAVLLIWVYDRGKLVFQYDSNPMYLSCPVCSYSSETVSAEYGDVEQLCHLLGVRQNSKALKSWLVRKKGLGFLSEHERLTKILALLGLPLPGAYKAQ
jgi:hypothetical protein